MTDLVTRIDDQLENGFRLYGDAEGLLIEARNELERIHGQRKQAKADSGQSSDSQPVMGSTAGERPAEEAGEGGKAESDADGVRHHPSQEITDRYVRQCREWGLWA